MSEGGFKIKPGYQALFRALIDRYGPPYDKPMGWDDVLNDAEHHLDVFDVAGYYVIMSRGAALSLASSPFTDMLEMKYFNSGSEVFGIADIDAMVGMTYKVYGEMLSYDDAGRGEVSARIGLFKTLLDKMVMGLMNVMAHVLDKAIEEGDIDLDQLNSSLIAMKVLAKQARTAAIDFVRYGHSVEGDLEDKSNATDRTRELFDSLVTRADQSVEDFLKDDDDDASDEQKRMLAIIKVWSFILTMGNNGQIPFEIMQESADILFDLGVPHDFVRQIARTGTLDDDDDDEESGFGIRDRGVAAVGSDKAKEIIDDFGALDLTDLLHAIDAMTDDDDEE